MDPTWSREKIMGIAKPPPATTPTREIAPSSLLEFMIDLAKQVNELHTRNKVVHRNLHLGVIKMTESQHPIITSFRHAICLPLIDRRPFLLHHSSSPTAAVYTRSAPSSPIPPETSLSVLPSFASTTSSSSSLLRCITAQVTSKPYYRYTTKSDIWCLGLIFLAVISNQGKSFTQEEIETFFCSGDAQRKLAIMVLMGGRSTFSTATDETTRRTVTELLIRMTSPDPISRPTAQEVVDTLLLSTTVAAAVTVDDASVVVVPPPSWWTPIKDTAIVATMRSMFFPVDSRQLFLHLPAEAFFTTFHIVSLIIAMAPLSTSPLHSSDLYFTQIGKAAAHAALSLYRCDGEHDDEITTTSSALTSFILKYLAATAITRRQIVDSFYRYIGTASQTAAAKSIAQGLALGNSVNAQTFRKLYFDFVIRGGGSVTKLISSFADSSGGSSDADNDFNILVLLS